MRTEPKPETGKPTPTESTPIKPNPTPVTPEPTPAKMEETDTIELAPDPSNIFKNWNRMPEHVKQHKYDRLGLNPDGSMKVTKQSNNEEEERIKVPGIAGKLSLERVIQLRDALNEVINEVKGTD